MSSELSSPDSRERNKSAGGNRSFELYSPRAGHPGWDGVEERARDLVGAASGTLEFDTGSLGERISEAKRITEALSTTARSMLTNHFRLKKGECHLLPPYFIWTMLNRCNFRCTYCDNHTRTGFYDLPEMELPGLEESKKILETIRKNVSGVYFCGGEPTLRQDLPELAEYASNNGHFPIMINTNGSRFHVMLKDPRYSRLLKSLDIVIVSLDALDLDRLSSVWGVKSGLCEQVVVNILALRKLQERVRFKLMVNTVITPETVAEADSILDWANDLGIWYSPVPMNCGPGISEELESDPDYWKLCGKIVARKKEGYKILGSVKLIEGLLKGKKINCFPSLVPHVDGDGNTYWPCKTASKLEPLKLNVLDYGSFDHLYREAEKMISVKNIHGNGPGQCGGDCQWMQNHVSDALAKGIEKPLRSGALREIGEFVGVV